MSKEAESTTEQKPELNQKPERKQKPEQKQKSELKQKPDLKQKTKARKEAEETRLFQLFLPEREARARGISYLFGIDEAGRGPLCGPVAAACCILPENAAETLSGLNDSKKLSEAKRETLAKRIKETALAYGIGLVSAERIDEINILNATYEAMTDAANACLDMLSERLCRNILPEETLFLIDGNRKVPMLHRPQETMVKGDANSASVAAASILAKVTRDHLLLEDDRRWPQYGFAKNKGYGTKQHIEALKKYGILPIHRKSFLKFLTAEERMHYYEERMQDYDENGRNV